MISGRFLQLFFLSSLIWSGSGRECCAQVPEPRPSPTSANPRARETYLRPNLSPQVWDVTAANLTSQKCELLAENLILLVRNFPAEKALNLEWKSRILSLALRLKPGNRDGLVANGQLARGVTPKPNETDPPARLDVIVASLLKLSIELFGDQSDKTTAAYVLGLHLLDIATHLDPTNKVVLDIRLKDAPPLLWKKLVVPSKGKAVSEELPDLRLAAGAVRLVLRNRGLDKEPGKPIEKFVSGSMSAAAKRVEGNARASLQVVLPPDADSEMELIMSAIRKLLIKRHSHWPAGWRVTMEAVEVKPSGQPAVYLGVGMLLDSLIGGQRMDEKVLVACGLDPESGITVPLMSLESLITFASGKPETVSNVLIISEQSLESAHDFLLLNRERAIDLFQLNLCVAKNFAECMELASVSRPQLLQQNLDRFEPFVAILKTKGVNGLRTPEIRKEINIIVEQNPNLFSMRLMRSLALGQIPTKLSRSGSLKQIHSYAGPILQAGSTSYPLKRVQSTATGTPWSKARSQIERLRPILSADVRPYADTLSDLAKSYDTWIDKPPTTSAGWNDLKRAVSDQRARMEQARSTMFSPAGQGNPRPPGE